MKFKFKFKSKPKSSKPTKIDKINAKTQRIQNKADALRKQNEAKKKLDEVKTEKYKNSKRGQRQQASDARVEHARKVLTQQVQGKNVSESDLAKLEDLTLRERMQLKRGIKDKNVKKLAKSVGRGSAAQSAADAAEYQVKKDLKTQHAQNQVKFAHESKMKKLETAQHVAKETARAGGITGAAAALAAPGMIQANTEKEESEYFRQGTDQESQ